MNLASQSVWTYNFYLLQSNLQRQGTPHTFTLIGRLIKNLACFTITVHNYLIYLIKPYRRAVYGYKLKCMLLLYLTKATHTWNIFGVGTTHVSPVNRARLL